MLRANESQIKELLGRMTVEEKLGRLRRLTWTGTPDPAAARPPRRRRRRRAACSARCPQHPRRPPHERTAAHRRRGVPARHPAAFRPRRHPRLLDHVRSRSPRPPASTPRCRGATPRCPPPETRTERRALDLLPDDGRHARAALAASPRAAARTPYLNAVFAVAKVQGYQGPADGTELGRDGRIAACAKHFVAYGGAEGGRDYSTVDVSGAAAARPLPAAVQVRDRRRCGHGHGRVQHRQRRAPRTATPTRCRPSSSDEWGFDGFVVSDYTGVQELIAHGFAEDGADAARSPLGAGLDMEMVSARTSSTTAGRSSTRRLTIERVDDAVTRILRLKYALRPLRRPLLRRVSRDHRADRGRAAPPRAAGPLPAAWCCSGTRRPPSRWPHRRVDRRGRPVRRLRRSAAARGAAPARASTRPSASSTVCARPPRTPWSATRAPTRTRRRPPAGGSADVTVIVVGGRPSSVVRRPCAATSRLPRGQEELIARRRRHRQAVRGGPGQRPAAGPRRLVRRGARRPGGLAPRHRGRSRGRGRPARHGRPGRQAAGDLPRAVGQIRLLQPREHRPPLRPGAQTRSTSPPTWTWRTAAAAAVRSRSRLHDVHHLGAGLGRDEISRA